MEWQYDLCGARHQSILATLFFSPPPHPQTAVERLSVQFACWAERNVKAADSEHVELIFMGAWSKMPDRYRSGGYCYVVLRDAQIHISEVTYFRN